ncbi:FAD-dependent monooxygenase [Streptomyces longispororuber]|uniref:FAD-dependent monooxygenase n=1 Tax=Streptomyces longispororuber TaxID=68230 RepID=UPI00370098C9
MPQVIVAGAGPVGLLAAALLDAAGVSVEVFERSAGPSRNAKAITVHPRTLEVLTVLRTTGGQRIADILRSYGTPLPRAHFAALPQTLDYSCLDTPYPFVLMVPQTRTEKVLADHLDHRGVRVHHNTPVTALEQDTAAVRVSTGRTVHEAGYLIGADGAHSLVRRQAGIAFPGSAPSAVPFVADVVLAEPRPTASHYWNRRTGLLSVLPIPDGLNRVFGAEVTDTQLTPQQARHRHKQPLTLPVLRDTIHRITGHTLDIRHAHWLSRTTDENRHADRYRTGRILLAGDAAHTQLPAGGQGLNVGLQDAANLAWKLAAELQGWARPSLVNGDHSYTRERRPVAEQLTTDTLAQGALMHTFTHGGEALRAMFCDLLIQDTPTHERLAGWLSGLAVAYGTAERAEAGHHPLTGTRAPDLAVREGSLLRTLRPDRYLLADFTPAADFSTLAGPRVHVTSARPRPGAWSGLAAALIRPDGYVAHAAHAGTEPDVTAAAVTTWTSPHHAA